MEVKSKQTTSSWKTLSSFIDSFHHYQTPSIFWFCTTTPYKKLNVNLFDSNIFHVIYHTPYTHAASFLPPLNDFLKLTWKNRTFFFGRQTIEPRYMTIIDVQKKKRRDVKKQNNFLAFVSFVLVNNNYNYYYGDDFDASPFIDWARSHRAIGEVCAGKSRNLRGIFEREKKDFWEKKRRKWTSDFYSVD